MPRIFEYDTEKVNNLFGEHSIFENREIAADSTTKFFQSDVTIAISMYKDLEKTKRCVDSVMKYTTGIDFDLIFLIDGAQDGIFDYFKNFEYEKTTIIYNTANRGGGVPWRFVCLNMLSEYVVSMASDVIVTHNWLSNMLTCLKSDPKIGMVVPMSSNVSNLQCTDLGGFSSEEEMQKKAAVFNQSDPLKWEERLRLINIVQVFRKPALMVLGIPYSDAGFVHNFGDDDLSFTMRRSGYKTILAGDTWIHHDHVRVTTSKEEYDSFNKSIAIGREDFKTKYYGIDAWDDVNNFIFYKDYISDTQSNIPNILGIDTRCGTPILEIKNAIKNHGKLISNCYAITSNPKYFLDLTTICGSDCVVCGDPLQSLDKFVIGSMDYIIIDNYINQYKDTFELIRKCASLLKDNGHIYVSLKNVYDLLSYMEMLGYINNIKNEAAISYTYSQFFNKIKDMGGDIKCIFAEQISPEEVKNILPLAENILQKSLNMNNEPQKKADMLMIKKWVFDITLG